MRSLKSTAFILAVAIALTSTLTSCQSIVKDKYSSASVTQVTDQPFTLGGKEGLYTGDWKGDRPEGNGDLIISDNEYYKGEWRCGILLGQGIISKIYDDGSSMYYKGECAYDTPAGEGTMYFSMADNQYFMLAEGDFTNESTLRCYITDVYGKLCDIGGINNGEFISYVDNPIDGITVSCLENDKGYILEGSPGRYIGQTDENGVPNGYGYYEMYPANNFQCSYLGEWKDGYIDGYYTRLWSNGALSIKVVGCLKDGYDVGEYESYTYDANGLTVKKRNYDTYDKFSTFELGDDGIYRGSYETTEYFNNDGTYGYNKRRKTYKLLDDGSYDLDYIYGGTSDEGEYCNYDQYGNVTDYGKPLAGGWQSLKSNEIGLKDKLIAAGVVLLGAYATYKFIIKPANEEILKTSEVFKERQRSISLKHNLLEKAEREAKDGNYNEVEKLLDEADHVTMPAIPW